MSRRQDREGVPRCEAQYLQNMRFWDDPRCKEDAKGWVQPFANWQGWEEFNRAAYALHCVLVWQNIKRRHPRPAPVIRDDGTIDRDQLHRGSDLARIESDMRSFRFHIARSRQCDRPRLP